MTEMSQGVVSIFSSTSSELEKYVGETYIEKNMSVKLLYLCLTSPSTSTLRCGIPFTHRNIFD